MLQASSGTAAFLLGLSEVPEALQQACADESEIAGAGERARLSGRLGAVLAERNLRRRTGRTEATELRGVSNDLERRMLRSGLAAGSGAKPSVAYQTFPRHHLAPWGNFYPSATTHGKALYKELFSTMDQLFPRYCQKPEQ